jgi:hypothetical protein
MNMEPTPWKQKGTSTMKRITLSKAVRLNCLECSSFSPSEVERCTVLDCVFWPFRFGMYPEAAERRGKQVDPYKLSGKSYDYPDGGPGKYKEIETPLWWEDYRAHRARMVKEGE